MKFIAQLKPAGLEFPADSGIERPHPPTKKGHAPRERLIDRRTLVYCAIRSHRSRSVRLIAPKLDFLGDLLGSLRLSFGNSNQWVSPKIRHYDRISTLDARVPRKLRKIPDLLVSLRLGAHVVGILEILPEIQVGKYILATLQKDNDPVWILDWARYHRSLGIDTLVLFDNNSRDQQALKAVLAVLAAEMRVTLMDWPFPYGDVLVPKTLQAQTGALACALTLSTKADWLVNLDIDEYLVSDGNSLQSRLPVAPFVGGLCLDSYIVPNYRSTDGLPTARDFTWRERKARGSRKKYIVKPRAVLDPRIHNARLYPPFIMREAVPAKLAFLHYVGLTTNWKTEKWDRKTVNQLDLRRYVDDRRVQNRLVTFDKTRRPGDSTDRQADSVTETRESTGRSLLPSMAGKL